MTRSPTTTGPLKPSPTFLSQTTGGPFFGHVALRPVSVETPLRVGPRNCGQSAAEQTAAAEKARQDFDRRGSNVGVGIVQGLGQRGRALIQPGPPDHLDRGGPNDRGGVVLEDAVRHLDRAGVTRFAEHLEHRDPDRAG